MLPGALVSDLDETVPGLTPSVTYAEGFAGPGVYSGGEPGSRVIAMKALVERLPPDKGLAGSCSSTMTSDVWGPAAHATTGGVPSLPRPNDTMLVVKIMKGTCAEHLEAELTAMGTWEQPICGLLSAGTEGHPSGRPGRRI